MCVVGGLGPDPESLAQKFVPGLNVIIFAVSRFRENEVGICSALSEGIKAKDNP